ncbi:neocarzinostatin apoprotein domain-containing protein [Nocardia sp. CDC159]|uniref:Neocarzinostatin apoprotein domain-containing protein n=1 Tax=Nocardia pulmonis TaxID=2951408 RepID=A0A9X2E0I0_9NOCA|nr:MULTISPECIES: neocarzinostatin apoprotein domain-containing protein [Nocardia]MCM6771927.1 neocarzinostatin apoprotein domain-containing protein [Nocardia pulmonis]MCM6785415.1 neocarzinostatin apoprotein domain-containing protein [Nocardia sp. CDC159]
MLAPAAAGGAPENAAALRVSASTGLTEGQRITVDGSGFRPGLAAVAVGLCREGFTSGLRDCDLDGGATFVNIGGDGTFPTVTLTARPRFNDIDCLRQRCVIAAAPLPGTEPAAVIAANSAAVPVDFAGSTLPAPTAAPTVTATAPATETGGPSIVLWSVTAALLTVFAGVALVDRRRL